MVAGKSEEELYRALGMDYIPPEMRENLGEIELAKKHALPKLIGYDELQGDLQVQTDWTDGAASIEEMAHAALGAGLKYIAITDHTKRLAMTNGLDEKRIQKQWLEIDRVNKKFGGEFTVLKGTECDILKDGSLDLPDEILAKLDVVGASVHSHFKLPQTEQTARVVRAMENPHVGILFHPTGRLIQKREAINLNIGEVIRVAKKTGTVLEIDAFPDRLDLKDEYIRKAVASGVKLAIDSDAHSPTHFSVLEYGIAQARRGWAGRGDIINAWPLDKMLKFLK
jgi:DNA polymerase (family 10)